MQHMSRWSAAIAALCLIAACADSASLTAPAGPAAVSANVTASASACEAELTALRNAIDDATFTGRNGSAAQANLVLKVDATRAKLEQGKPADAIEKLEDVRTNVVALSTPDANGKTKLGEEDAADIISAVDAAEACIRQQGTAAA